MKTDFSQCVLSAPLGHTYLFSVGQAGYIIKSKSGQLLAIDLYLSDCVERTESEGFKRMLPKILQAGDILFDAVIATHPHLDHFDMDSIPTLVSNNKTTCFASVNCEEYIDLLKLKREKFVFVKPGDVKTYGDFKIEFVNCDHGEGAPDAFGVIVSVDGLRLYEAGDTCLRLDRVEEIVRNGPIDIMIAPINGAFGNMNESDCALYAKAINPKMTIPCHYGMFARHGGNPWLFMEKMIEYNKTYLIMTQGEMYEL